MDVGIKENSITKSQLVSIVLAGTIERGLTSEINNLNKATFEALQRFEDNPIVQNTFGEHLVREDVYSALLVLKMAGYPIETDSVNHDAQYVGPRMKRLADYSDFERYLSKEEYDSLLEISKNIPVANRRTPHDFEN